LSVFENRFFTNSSKTEHPFFIYLGTVIVLRDFQKFGVVAEIFPLEGAKMYDRGGRLLCRFVEGD